MRQQDANSARDVFRLFPDSVPSEVIIGKATKLDTMRLALGYGSLVTTCIDVRLAREGTDQDLQRTAI